MALPDIPDSKFDLVFTSPPWGAERYFAGPDKFDDIWLVRLIDIVKRGGILALHLPKIPKNMNKPDEVIEISSRATYRASTTQHIYVWRNK